tara:strand:- start:891 stop:1247 length:357 start_codon:yes stop_codon:yes gene_type:complete
MKENITYRTDPDTKNHIIDYSNIQIVFDERDGDDIGSNGGLRFRLFYKKSIEPLELVKADEFVIYPDAIDWENGGQMKKEYLDRIKELKAEAEAEMKAKEEARQPPVSGTLNEETAKE